MCMITHMFVGKHMCVGTNIEWGTHMCGENTHVCENRNATRLRSLCAGTEGAHWSASQAPPRTKDIYHTHFMVQMTYRAAAGSHELIHQAQIRPLGSKDCYS